MKKVLALVLVLSFFGMTFASTGERLFSTDSAIAAEDQSAVREDVLPTDGILTLGPRGSYSRNGASSYSGD